jgi:hypothetical protein
MHLRISDPAYAATLIMDRVSVAQTCNVAAFLLFFPFCGGQPPRPRGSARLPGGVKGINWMVFMAVP